MESLGAIFASESADWQQQQQQLQLVHQQQLAACGGAFKCVEALTQNIPRLVAALHSNLESLDSAAGGSVGSGGGVALALQSCEELQSLTRDFERLLRDAVHAVVAATRSKFSVAFDAVISATRAPATVTAAVSGGNSESVKGQSTACLQVSTAELQHYLLPSPVHPSLACILLQALCSIDSLYVLFKATLPEPVVENIMTFILQV